MYVNYSISDLTFLHLNSYSFYNLLVDLPPNFGEEFRNKTPPNPNHVKHADRRSTGGRYDTVASYYYYRTLSDLGGRGYVAVKLRLRSIQILYCKALFIHGVLIFAEKENRAKIRFSVKIKIGRNNSSFRKSHYSLLQILSSLCMHRPTLDTHKHDHGHDPIKVRPYSFKFKVLCIYCELNSNSMPTYKIYTHHPKK